MATVMICAGVAGPFITDNEGQYLKSCDFEAFDGRGVATFTTNLAEAMKFESKMAAFDFWTTRSKTVPTRPDGKPNKPLTAYHMVFKDVE